MSEAHPTNSHAQNPHASPPPRVFTCPAGVSTLEALLNALFSGQLIEGFFPAQEPLLFATTTIYVPTRRAGRDLNALITARFAPAPVLLPRIIPLADLGEEAFWQNPTSTDDIFAPLSVITRTERRLILTSLIQEWGKVVEKALIPLDGNEHEPLLVPASLLDASAMAADLARLLDDMTLWQTPLSAFDLILEERFDRYFEITKRFLAIAREIWPQLLLEWKSADPTQRQDSMLREQAKRIRDGLVHHPVIVVGSTGTLPATAEFLKAVALHPQGAIVLPCLDQHLDGATFAGLQCALSTDPASYTHPQAILGRLLNTLNMDRTQVTALASSKPSLASRERLLSEALRPADTTDMWAVIEHQLTLKEREVALEGVSVIIANDVHEEALSAAIALRAALENPNATAALITPDRLMAERVEAELKRWNITANDTGGRSLIRTPLGTFVMGVGDYLAKPHPEALLALLIHPLTRCGLSAPRLAMAQEALLCGVFQGRVPEKSIPALITHLHIAQKMAQEGRHIPAATRRLTPEHWNAAREALHTLEKYLTPLLSLFEKGVQDVSIMAPLHWEACLHISRDENGESTLLSDEFYSALQNLFEELNACSRVPVFASAFDYTGLIATLMRECIVRPREGLNARVQIWGLLEARLLRADCVVLGGLDEHIWPPAATPDAFLTRSMRLTLGLPPPEQRIGQTAHDFIAAMGHENVIITRALKRGTSPSVPSRFVQRLAAYVGKHAWDTCCERGNYWLDLARQHDAPTPQAAAKRPYPTPPASLQPTSLSVTEIETLIRDPYAIYAKHVLKLTKLEGMRITLDASDYGQWVHAVFETYGRALTHNPYADSHTTFAHATRDALIAYAEFPEITQLWLSRFDPIQKAFCMWDSALRENGTHIAYEAKGHHTFMLRDGTAFSLRGYADRIHITTDGQATIVDFKTGTPPSNTEIYQGLAPQLTLEAMMLSQGGFKDSGFEGLPAHIPLAAIDLTYIKVGGSKVFDIKPVKPPQNKGDKIFSPLPEHINESWQQLVSYLSALRQGTRAFSSRRFPKTRDYGSDYDHLARVKEWSATGGCIEGDESESAEENA
jgi:ATP-dependent helicase/nuclease subunit B